MFSLHLVLHMGTSCHPQQQVTAPGCHANNLWLAWTKYGHEVIDLNMPDYWLGWKCPSHHFLGAVTAFVLIPSTAVTLWRAIERVHNLHPSYIYATLFKIKMPPLERLSCWYSLSLFCSNYLIKSQGLGLSGGRPAEYVNLLYGYI